MVFTIARVDAAAARHSQDRAVVVSSGGSQVVIVADGAGGTTHGTEAAEAVVAHAARAVTAGRGALDGAALASLLAQIDAALLAQGHGGLTTAVLVALDAGGVRGASVGDSEAWVLRDGGAPAALTQSQRRRPMLGAGGAVPVAFARGPLAPGETLLVATDGLFGYASVERIVSAAREPAIETAARRMADAARLSNGALQDDLTIVLVRVAALAAAD